MGEVRTSSKAETTARDLLDRPDHPFRTFAIIRHYIGGFDDDELRRLLVSAGAIRVVTEDGIEAWALRDLVRNFGGVDFLKTDGIIRKLSSIAPLDRLLPRGDPNLGWELKTIIFKEMAAALKDDPSMILELARQVFENKALDRIQVPVKAATTSAASVPPTEF